MAEFTIESCPNTTFRDGYVSPVDLLAISTQVDFDAFSKTKELFSFALEHTEVMVGDKWLPVKTSGRDVYMPIGVETNYSALNDICTWYLQNVISKVFTNSAELTSDT